MANHFDQYDRKPGGNTFDRFDRPDPIAAFAAQQPPALTRPTAGVGETATDIGRGLMSGLAGLTRTGGELYGLASGNMDNPAVRLGRDAQEYWQAGQSDALKAQQEARAAEIEQADGVLGQTWAAVAGTLKRPRLVADTVASNIASLLPSGAAGRGAATLAARAGTSPAVAGRLGLTAAIGTGAAQQGADVSGEAYESALTDTNWEANPVYQQRVAAGESPDAVQRDMALAAGRMTFPGAAAISAASQAIPGGAAIERALVGGAARNLLARPGPLGRAAGMVRGALGEGTQEMIEEGGGQAFGNLVRQQTLDPSVEVSEGVGEAGGLGFVGGLALGAPAGLVRRFPDARPGSLSDAANAVDEQQGPPAAPAPAPASDPVQETPQPEAAPAPERQTTATAAELLQRARNRLNWLNDQAAAGNMDEEMVRDRQWLAENAENPQALAERLGVTLVEEAVPPPPAVPWHDAETGEVRSPTDQEVIDQFHHMFEAASSGGISRSSTAASRALAEEWGVDQARLRELRKQAVAERKAGITPENRDTHAAQQAAEQETRDDRAVNELDRVLGLPRQEPTPADESAPAQEPDRDQSADVSKMIGDGVTEEDAPAPAREEEETPAPKEPAPEPAVETAPLQAEEMAGDPSPPQPATQPVAEEEQDPAGDAERFARLFNRRYLAKLSGAVDGLSEADRQFMAEYSARVREQGQEPGPDAIRTAQIKRLRDREASGAISEQEREELRRLEARVANPASRSAEEGLPPETEPAEGLSREAPPEIHTQQPAIDSLQPAQTTVETEGRGQGLSDQSPSAQPAAVSEEVASERPSAQPTTHAEGEAERAGGERVTEAKADATPTRTPLHDIAAGISTDTVLRNAGLDQVRELARSLGVKFTSRAGKPTLIEHINAIPIEERAARARKALEATPPAAPDALAAGDPITITRGKHAGKTGTAFRVGAKSIGVAFADGTRSNLSPKVVAKAQGTPKESLPDATGTAAPAATTEDSSAVPADQPVHQDAGQAPEPATPEVVSEALEESSKKTPLDVAAAKKWLIGEIDKAIESASDDVFDGRLDEIGARTVFARGKGYVTFEVPGDGTFKVLNTKQYLRDFRKKVERSPGFRPKAKIKPAMPRERARPVPVVQAVSETQAEWDNRGRSDAELKDLERSHRGALRSEMMASTPAQRRIGEIAKAGKDLETVQREMVRRGLIEQTDLDKAAAPAEESTIEEDAADARPAPAAPEPTPSAAPATAFRLEALGTKGLLVHGDVEAARARLAEAGFRKKGRVTRQGLRFDAKDRAAIEAALGVQRESSAGMQEVGRVEGRLHPEDLPDRAIVQDQAGEQYVVLGARHHGVRAVPYTKGQRPQINSESQVRFYLRPGDRPDTNERGGPLFYTGRRLDLNTLKEIEAALNPPQQATPAVAERIEAAAAEAAHSDANNKPEPTQAQKEAGNYAKGHVRLHGLDISIENPRGSTRSGTRADGTTWSHQMSDHYGYIKRTEGADGEHVDVYIGPNPESGQVFIVDQMHQDSDTFDEHKVMLGFESETDAVKAYRSNFDPGWKVGPVTAMPMEQFKAWLKDGATKPAAKTTPETPNARPDEQPGVEDVRRVGEPAPGPADGVGADREGAVEQSAPAVIEDFGERLEGARKFLPPSLQEDVSDESIASLPLSKLWPANAHEGIEDATAAAAMFAVRAQIPAKPRAAHRIRRWVEQVKQARDVARMIEEVGLAEFEQQAGRLASPALVNELFPRIRLLAQLPRDQWKRVERVSEYPNAFTFEGQVRKPAPFSSVTIDGKTHTFAGVGRIGPDEVVKVTGMLGQAAPRRGGLTPSDFEIRRYRKNGEVFVNRKGDREQRPLKTFTGDDAAKQARAWLKDSIAEAEAAWEAVKARDNVGKADMRRAENRSRTGVDRRKGKDVTPEMFDEAFGFRGTQFGNWVGQGKGARDRQGMLNEAYDALHDLADILGIPTRAISLEGTLGLSFGARGKGLASAHFEPGNLVINLTKTRGAGTLAHEWFHALDNYFARHRGGEVPMAGSQQAYRENNFITYRPEPMMRFKQGGPVGLMTRAELMRRHAQHPTSGLYKPEKWEVDPNHKQGVRPVVEKAFADLVEALNASPMRARARDIDGIRGLTKGEGYWSSIIERGARAFENYVISKMAQQGWTNDYLANIQSIQDWLARGKNPSRYPYLKPEEESPITEAFDRLFDTIEVRPGEDGTVGLFNLADTPGTPATSTPQHHDSVQRAVTRVVREWGENAPRVRVVAKPSELPAAARSDPRHTRARGFYHEGTVWMVSSNLPTRRLALETLAHEAVGHYGIDQIIDQHVPGGWDRLQADIMRVVGDPSRASAELRAAVADMLRRYGDRPPAEQARELLAIMAERGLRNSFTGRVIAALRAWLRQMFPGMRFTDADLRALLARSAEYLHQGTSQAERRAAISAYSFSDPSGPFYSALLRATQTGKGAPRKANAQAWKQWLDGAQRRGEFRQAERDWLGLDSWLDGRETTTRAELAEFVQANQVQVQDVVLGSGDYGRYTLPGGENYSELLLTLPTDANRAGAEYRSVHFDQPNILANVRYNERTDADGKRVLFLEEIQSDWAQGIRRQESGVGRLPSMPFKGTDDWAMLAFKRMVRHAAENGFDRIAWTTGDQQAERYDLSKQISRITFDDNTSGGIGPPRMDGPPARGQLRAYDHSGNLVMSELVQPARAEEFVGKEVAERLFGIDPRETRVAGLGVRRRELSGLDLQVGGEGMRGFYDRILPKAVAKWARPFGAKVGAATIRADGPTTVHSIDLTPAMRDAALEGLPLFSFAGERARGADLRALEAAKDREAIGRDSVPMRDGGVMGSPDDTHRETGWHKGVDGKWRWEIDDSGARVRTGWLARAKAGGVKLDQVLDHPDLFAAYPQLADITVRTNPGLRARGSYDERTRTLTLRGGQAMYPPRGPKSLRALLLHETQHAIQAIEGFARGGNLDGVKTMAEYQRFLATANAKGLTDAELRAAYAVYHRLAGEVEARNTQRRAGFNAAQRRRFTPEMTQDVKRGNQIVRGAGGPALAMEQPERDESRRASIEPEPPEGHVRLYHGGTPGVREIEGDTGPGNIFGGLFASRSDQIALSHGDSLYAMDVPEDAILVQTEIDHRIDPARTEKALRDAMPWLDELDEADYEIAYLAAVEDRAAQVADEDLMRVFREDSVGEADWEAQRVRGLVAKSLGYKAVEMTDEHGTSYLVLPGVAVHPVKDLTAPQTSGALFSLDNPAEATENIDALLAQPDGSLFERAKAWLRGKGENLVPGALGWLQRRHLTELIDGHVALKGYGKQYDERVQMMEADRGQLIGGAPDAAENPQDMLKRGAAVIAEDLRKFTFKKGLAGWLGRRNPEAARLAKVMHTATLNGLDPSKEYSRLLMEDSRGNPMQWTRTAIRERIAALRGQARGRSGDDKRMMIEEVKALRALPAREKARERLWPRLQAEWQALSPEAKKLYTQMRDWHSQMADEIEDAVIARMEAIGRDMEITVGADLAKRYVRQAVQRARAEFESNRVEAPYFPLNRDGDYWVSFVGKDGEYGFKMFESANELAAAERKLKAAGFEIEAQGRRDTNYRAKDAPSGSFIADIIGTLRKAGASETVLDDVYQTFLKTLPEMSLRKRRIHRKKVPGFSTDILRAFSKNAYHGAYQLARLRHAHEMQYILDTAQTTLDQYRRDTGADPDKSAALDVARGDVLLGELKRRHDYIMAPKEARIANAANSLGFVYFLGATPAAAIVNLTQNAQVTLPVLGAHHGWAKASRMLGAAVRDALRTGGNIDRTLTDPDERRAYQTLRARGDIDKTQAHTLAALSEGNQLQSGPVWSRAMGAVSWMFHTAEVANREAAGMAAYRLARSRGDSFEDAVQYASDIINGTHFDYSASNRARHMQGNVMRVVTQFKSYSQGMTWFMYRNLIQALKGETPEVRAVALKSLTGTMAMTGLMAGVMGLPIINAIKAVAMAAHAAFGDDDEPWDFDTEFRQWLAENLGPDVARHVADGPVGQITGANLATRVSLSNLWFRDNDRALEGSDLFHSLLEGMVGPLGGLTKNLFVGTEMIGQGHTWRGVETMLPKFAKDAMKATRFAHEGANTLRGDPIVEDISGPDALIQAIGFQPTRLFEQRKVTSALKGYEVAITDRRQALMNAFAMATRTNSDRAEVMARIHAFNAKYPEIAIKSESLRQSLRARARYSAQAEGGVVVNKRLAGRVREMAGVQQ